MIRWSAEQGKACNRCRERKVKCDKAQPECQRCKNYGKPCTGYHKRQSLQDEGQVMLEDRTVGDADQRTFDEMTHSQHDASCIMTSAGLGQSVLDSLPGPLVLDPIYANTDLDLPNDASNTGTDLPQLEGETAFLLNHFSEDIAPWMDLFDNRRFFEEMVTQAVRNPLLTDVVAAVSAKQLGVCTRCTRWLYRAAEYYDKAIICSQACITALSCADSEPTSSDDLVYAVSILSLYEYIDNAGSGWMQHLTGLKMIFDVLSSSQRAANEKVLLGRRAAFWNFVRADLKAAYLNRSTTILDTEDTSLWRGAGLEPSNLETSQAAHTLLWIILRIVNFLYGQDDDSTTWQRLNSMLDWLSESFHPCAQIQNKNGQTGLLYSSPLLAAAALYYHFARLLLKHQISTHATAVLRIALGRPRAVVKVEMLLPLCLARSYLISEEDRQTAMELMLATIEETGCMPRERLMELACRQPCQTLSSTM